MFFVFCSPSFFLISCGYSPVATITLPNNVSSILVAPPDVSRTSEPELSRWLASGLVRELARRGIAASSLGRAEARLTCTVIHLEGGGVPLVDPGARTLVGQDLLLRLELRLATEAGQTLWRSGLLEARQPWIRVPASGAADLASRHQTIRALSERAARSAVEALASGF